MRLNRLPRLLLLLVAVCLALPAKAQPMIEQVPADAVLYFGWRGAADMGPDYAGSNLQGLVEQSGLMGAMPQLMEAIKRFAQTQDLPPDAAELMGMSGTLWSEMWDKGGCVYVLPPLKDGPPLPRVAMIWNQPKDQDAAAALTTAIQRLENIIKESAELPVLSGKVAGGQFLSLNFDAAGAFKSLNTTARFQQASAQINRNSALLVYADVQQWVAEIDTLIRQNVPENDDAADLWPKLRDSSGLAGFNTVIFSSGLKGKNWHTQVYADAPSPRVGLLSLLDNKPVEAKSLGHIPKTATYVSVFTLDPAKMMSVARGMVGSVDPDMVAQMDGMIAEASENLGFDIEKKLVNAMGPVWSSYVDPMIAGNGFSSMVLVNELKDPKSVDQALASLAEMGNGLAQVTKDVGLDVRLRTKQYKGVNMTYLGVPLVSPSYMVHNGRLYIALFPQGLEMAIDQSGQKNDSILANPSFIQTMAQFNGKPYTSLTFTDLPKTAAEGYGTNLMLMQTFSGLTEMLGRESSALQMPPVGKIMPFVQPSGSQMWTDNSGIHIQGIEPFPGSSVLGPLSGMSSSMGASSMFGILSELMTNRGGF